MFDKEERDLIIYPASYYYVSRWIACVGFVVIGIILVLCAILFTSLTLYLKIICVIFAITGFVFTAFILPDLIRSTPVWFVNNHLKCNGYKNEFNKIDRDCKEFKSYRFTNISIEFTFTDGTREHFLHVQFSKKQNLKILKEIKSRGGFADWQIAMDDYYWGKFGKSCKKFQ